TRTAPAMINIPDQRMSAALVMLMIIRRRILIGGSCGQRGPVGEEPSGGGDGSRLERPEVPGRPSRKSAVPTGRGRTPTVRTVIKSGGLNTSTSTRRGGSYQAGPGDATRPDTPQ